jgi:hypothetical protein
MLIDTEKCPAKLLAMWIATAMGRPDIALKILLEPTPEKTELRICACRGHRIGEDGFQQD